MSGVPCLAQVPQGSGPAGRYVNTELSILIIDDDEVDRMALRRSLRTIDAAAHVQDAGDSASGLSQLQRQIYDCAFVDYRLPDGDGLEILQRAREQHIETPIVMLTGHGDEMLAVEALKSGAVDYLPKAALTAERLWRSLRHVLRLKQTEQERNAALHKLVESERALRHMAHAIQNAAESVMITDIGGNIIYVNPAFTSLAGYSRQEVMGRNPRLLKTDRHPPEFFRSMWQAITAGKIWRGEVINRRKDGRLFEAALTIAPVHDDHGNREGYVATHRDITEEKRIAQEMRRLAHTDELTGLYNRRHLMERLDEEMARVRRYRRSFCLMLIDLDHFKRINDTYGHLKGDEVLVTSAHLIREVARATDMAGRYGGEEFCVILPETGLLKGQLMAERVRTRFAQQCYRVDADEFRVTCSIGLAQCTEDITDRSVLLKRADDALYSAKEAGRNRVEVAL